MTATTTPRDHLTENTEHALQQWMVVVRGHDAVHPNRSDCGGIGRCLLMRTEHTAEQEVIDHLEALARRGRPFTLTLSAVGVA